MILTFIQMGVSMLTWEESLREGYTKEGEYFQTSTVRAGFDKNRKMYSIFGIK